jgi:hypothetical protein
VSSETPLYVEPVLGWRAWHVEHEDDGPHLASWVKGGQWPAGDRLEARCRSFGLRGSHRHPAPRRDHGCGIYALRRKARAEALVSELFENAGGVHAPVALGRVSLWGRVIENTDGWRGQYAYPYDLTLFGGTEELRRRLAATYAVDVSLAS